MFCALPYRKLGFLVYFVALSLPIVVLSRTPLCADPKTDGFLGLVVDENVYDVQEGDPFVPSASNSMRRHIESNDTSPQKWVLVEEEYSLDPELKSPRNSFAKKYLQVRPDISRSYPAHSTFLTSPEQLEGVSPAVTFTIRAEKSGTHLLFLRWTGGDNFGGGDSLYVALKDKKTNKYVSGAETIKPAVEAIDGPLSNFGGCCYTMETHACPCYEKEEDAAVCTYFSEKDNTTHSLWQPRASASKFGAKCPVGAGAMTVISAPKWYLFAGQEKGNVEDFDAEPWDATCEAEGDNTADSGRDFATWDLSAGRDYDLNVFVREDGTALDAIYIAGPGGEAPNYMKRYTYGDSTICPPSKKSSSNKAPKFFMYTAVVAGSSIILALFVTKTAVGSRLLHQVTGRGSNNYAFNEQSNQMNVQNSDSEIA